MSIFGRVMLIQYFMAYLIRYFYNLKTKCNRQRPIIFLKSAEKINYTKINNINQKTYNK